jgi:2-polyprenyl-3-methyl-5-hydroxy-6-metoxy-1,4-benzoquinol methylase
LELGTIKLAFGGSDPSAKFNMVMSLPLVRPDNAQRVLRIHGFLEAMPFGSANGTVLDVGAGTGIFLARFLDVAWERGLTWQALALKPAPIAAAHWQSVDMFMFERKSSAGVRLKVIAR